MFLKRAYDARHAIVHLVRNHPNDALVGSPLSLAHLVGERLDEVEGVLIAAVGEREVTEAIELWGTGQTKSPLLAERHGEQSLAHGGRHHALCSRVQVRDIAVEVALHDAHGRGFDEEAEERVLLLQAEVLAAQTRQQVVERAHDDVSLILSRKG